jgi:hypothetical protein
VNILFYLVTISGIIHPAPIFWSINPEQKFRDRQGKEISLEKWNELNGQKEYASIKQEIFEGFFISTVWLGIVEDGYYFETVAFKNDKPEIQFLYLNEQDALRGHEQIKLGIKQLNQGINVIFQGNE